MQVCIKFIGLGLLGKAIWYYPGLLGRQCFGATAGRPCRLSFILIRPYKDPQIPLQPLLQETFLMISMKSLPEMNFKHQGCYASMQSPESLDLVVIILDGFISLYLGQYIYSRFCNKSPTRCEIQGGHSEANGVVKGCSRCLTGMHASCDCLTWYKRWTCCFHTAL